MGTRSHFVAHEPVRIELDGEWIAVKPKLSVGDKNALYTAMVSVGDSATTSKIEVGAYLAALLETAIVDWHLLDSGGKEIPFDKARIQDFDPDDPLIELVQDEVAKRNPFGQKKTPGSAS
jgi:hypothetical protein